MLWSLKNALSVGEVSLPTQEWAKLQHLPHEDISFTLKFQEYCIVGVHINVAVLKTSSHRETAYVT